mgnify:CR=1 FL=1
MDRIDTLDDYTISEETAEQEDAAEADEEEEIDVEFDSAESTESDEIATHQPDISSVVVHLQIQMDLVKSLWMICKYSVKKWKRFIVGCMII